MIFRFLTELHILKVDYFFFHGLADVLTVLGLLFELIIGSGALESLGFTEELAIPKENRYW